MKLKNSRLFAITESLITRYRIGSFLVGDQIKILDKIKSHECYKNLPVAELEILECGARQSLYHACRTYPVDTVEVPVEKITLTHRSHNRHDNTYAIAVHYL